MNFFKMTTISPSKISLSAQNDIIRHLRYHCSISHDILKASHSITLHMRSNICSCNTHHSSKADAKDVNLRYYQPASSSRCGANNHSPKTVAVLYINYNAGGGGSSATAAASLSLWLRIIPVRVNPFQRPASRGERPYYTSKEVYLVRY